MTIGPRRSTPLGGRTNRGFGGGFTFSGFATSILAGLAAFAARSFFGFAALFFFVGAAGASTGLAVGVGIAAAIGGSGGGASRTGASGATGAVYCCEGGVCVCCCGGATGGKDGGGGAA